MRALAIFRFELSYQARRAWPWLILVALVALTFQFMRVNYVSDAMYSEYVVNSPFLVAGATIFGGLMWLIAGGVIAGEAAARDVTTRMHPLVYTTSVSKAEYLGGRFAAAFVVNALLLAGVQAGILLATYAPGVPADLIGPFRPLTHITPYVYIALINAFATTAIQFALATASGRPMAAYFGSFLLFFVSFFIASALLFWQWWGGLLDAVGVRFLEELAREWTETEKNHRLIALEGMFLRNRAIWTAIGAAALALTYARFRFAHRVEGGWLRRLRVLRWRPTLHVSSLTGVPTLVIAWTSFRAIVFSWTGAGMLIGITFLTMLIVLDQMTWSGVPLIPATILVLQELTGPLSTELSRWLIVPLLTIFLAGELVWRERDHRVAEIADALPGSEWAPLAGKFIALGFMLALLMSLLSLAGVVAQAILGYNDVDLGLYAKVMLGLQLTDYLLFAALALLVHVVANQKYAGHLIAILIYVVMALPQMFGLEHSLLVFGAGPKWSYTEMRGFAASIAPWAWFKAYWAAWALLLMVAARLLWVRGRETRMRPRLRIARQRLTGPTRGVLVASLALIAAIGGFVFYNTNVLNAYVSMSERAERQAEYERRYGRYADLAQPDLTATNLHVEIYPDVRSATIHGTYTLVNRSETPIESIHVTTAPAVQTASMAFDRSAANALTDETHFYRIYTLERPLSPGETLTMTFELRVAPRGFREDGVSEAIAANGTRIPSGWLPEIGYQRSRELLAPGDRRDHDLPARPIIPGLEDASAPAQRSGATTLEAVIGTRDDQTAVAPGALRESWQENGRRYFRYVTDAPIGQEYALLSARYATREGRWEGDGHSVDIRVLHHPPHAANIDRYIRAIRASLDYYSREFGPYPYGHLTFAEVPTTGIGMHADSSMMTFTEGSALWRPNDDDDQFDLPFAVVAHEMAHQWTVPYAVTEGAPVLSEGVAWYYGLKAVQHARGEGQLQHLLAFMRQPQPFPPIRRGEPLLRGLDPYMSYRRGPFALYAMSEYIGADRVNLALRRTLEAHRPQDAPLATMLDLYRELQAVTPAEYQGLLHDFFEVNTFWELETQQAMAREREDGAWDVTLDVRARKTVYDEAGNESQVPIDDWIEIGVYAEGDAPGQPMHLDKRRITSAAESITITVPRKPVRAGIDPRFLLTDTEREDNVKAIQQP